MKAFRNNTTQNGHGLGLLIVDDFEVKRFHWDFELFNRSCGGCTAKIAFQTDSPLSISEQVNSAKSSISDENLI
ncbi:hypothetical protein O9929_11355 [Vibrio lentus]|nr:hypothetical protein [Vibrio lentus]